MKIFQVMIFIVLASCATRPTEQEISSLYYGLPPQANMIEQIFKNTVKPTLIDPESIQVRNVRGPIKFWSKQNNRLAGYWLICGEVNAKNRFGGYVGFKPEVIWANPNGSGLEPTIPGSPGCILGNMKQEVDPCNFYAGVSDFLKCR
jgi:hypothetical protein